NTPIERSVRWAAETGRWLTRPLLLQSGLVLHALVSPLAALAFFVSFALGDVGSVAILVVTGVSFLVGAALLAGADILSRRSFVATIVAGGVSLMAIGVAVFAELSESVIGVPLAIAAIANFVLILNTARTHRRVSDAISQTGRGLAGRLFFGVTIGWHGLCVAWVLLICVGLLLFTDEAYGLGVAYLYTFFVHAPRFIWLGVRSLMLSRRIGRLARQHASSPT
ncbi:MAG: hypothetical protein K2X32_00940, partial [Phycisphaerales bacterium]|nr:hypothetical protein [Phycisphaerales bacterium]